MPHRNADHEIPYNTTAASLAFCFCFRGIRKNAMERILELVEGVPELPSEQIYWLIDHSSRVDKTSFKVRAMPLAAA